jgi:outer membrane immunogenic protein
MKKLATCAVAVTGLLGTSAFAADIAVKGPPVPPPAPVYNWTGWYVGVNAGASFGTADTDFHGAPVFAVNGADTRHITSAFALSDQAQPDGFMGGGQIGYNWQYSPLIVVGVEADFQGALEKDTSNLGPQNVNFFVSASSFCGTSTTSCTATVNHTTQIDWFGTVRARIGYVWGNGSVMSYLTGGLAYGEVKINGTNTISGPFEEAPFAAGTISATGTFSQSKVNTGWVVGYGTEGVIDFWGARNWTWKIEGLWMDLGSLDATGPSSISCISPCLAVGAFFTGGQVTTHTHFTDGILRGGLNYKFY